MELLGYEKDYRWKLVERYEKDLSEETIRGIFQTLKILFEGGKHALHENVEEGHRENLHCDKDYDDNYQN